MAHIGSFVPASAATIGLTDAILSRMNTTESVSLNLSAFMIDLNQLSKMIRFATERSMLIIDEFGKGTDAIGESFNSKAFSVLQSPFLKMAKASSFLP